MPEITHSPNPAFARPMLRFNAQPVPWVADLSLADLLTHQGIAQDAVATAVNGQFVARALRATTLLNASDDVLTFQAIVGG